MIIETLRSQLEASNVTIRQMSSTIDNLQQTISDLRKTVANLESLLKERVTTETLTRWDFGSGGENPCVDLTIIFGQLVLCMLSDVGMSFHPVKRWFSRTEVSSIEAKTPLGRALLCNVLEAKTTFWLAALPSGALPTRGASANSLWQGGRRRAHSVRDCLPRWDFFGSTLAGRYQYTLSVALWLPKWIWRSLVGRQGSRRRGSKGSVSHL